MKFTSFFPAVHPVCINVEERKKRKKHVIQQAKEQKMKIHFHNAKLHKNTKRGCLESHTQVIENAVKEGHKFVFIMEDDVVFVRSIQDLPKPPEEWDMLYLGGTIKHIFSTDKHSDILQNKKKDWLRVTCWNAHSYVVNLQNKDLVKDILESRNTNDEEMEIDRYYASYIHTKYKAYICHPITCIQKNGYSDIEGREVEYSFMKNSIYGLRQPTFTIQDGNYTLNFPEVKEEDLPGVSLITPTKDREWIFSLPRFNISRFQYPPDKLEWIIVDSSVHDDLKYQFVGNKRVKYIHVDEPCTIAHKRNLACKMAKFPVIMHMDDDDVYTPESILARVKPLICYENTECVGCSKIGTYNIVHDTSFISSDGLLSLSEASMAYTKEFWSKQQFDPGCEKGEYYSFLQGRLDKVVDIPYIFIIIALHHNRNFTEKNNTNETIINKATGNTMNFPDIWDEEMQIFIQNLRKYMKHRSWEPIEEKKD